ncbi:MAG TPA: AAA family ATPase [Stellaceae bacterium]|nr:AAA family ATPase [Stellaceae bacterium]
MRNSEPGTGTSSASGGPRLLACLIDPATMQAVHELIAARNWRNAEVIDGGLVAARGRLEQSSAPRLLIVDVDDVADPVQSLSELADISPAEMSVIAIGQYNDLSLYRDLLELGVTEYLTKPVTVATLERALLKEERRAAPRQEHKEAQIIVLLGARGGVGTTTVAAGIAWCLAEEEKQSVTLVDLDLHFGNLALSLDLVPGSGLREALEYPTRIDSRLLSSATLSKTERLRVLAAEEALIEQPKVAPGALDAVFNVLRTDCDFIIIDMPRHFDDVARRVVTLASTICIITDLSLAAARDTIRLIELAKGMSPGARRLIIGNHVGANHRGEVSKADFERAVATPLDHVIPFDATVALATSSTGAALPAAMRTSKAAAAIRAIAIQLSGKQPAAKRALMATLLPSWLKRSA